MREWCPVPPFVDGQFDDALIVGLVGSDGRERGREHGRLE